MLNSLKSILPLCVLTILSAFCGAALYALWAKPSEVILEKIEQNARLVAQNDLFLKQNLRRSSMEGAPSDFIAAANLSKTSVVHVRALELTDESNLFNRVYNSSSGSGVLISADGYIVTNNHVITAADKVEIILNDKREFLATVVGVDEATDLAVLKIEIENAPHLTFGNSDDLQIGEWVMAIGNPFKLSSTVTAGIVSAKARSIDIMGTEGIESFIQTDAAVNPGNSGGALINTAGELVGINTAILSKSGSYEGFSFAVPINLANKVIEDIKEFGAVQRGWMGIKINNVNAGIAADVQLKQISGVLISGFTRSSAAKEAGMKIGDVVVGLNDMTISSVPEFTEQVGRYRPGDQMLVHFIREGIKQQTTVVLKNNLNTTDFIAIRKDKILVDLGFEVRDMDSVEKQTLEVEGAYVVSVYHNSTIGNTNLEPGYIITKANNQKITNVGQLVTFLKENKGQIINLEGLYSNYPGKYPYSFINE